MNDDIRIDIIVNLQGLESVNRLNSAFRSMDGSQMRVAKSARDLDNTNWRQIKSWQGLTAHLTRVEQNLDAVWRAGVHLKALGGDLLRITKGLVGVGTSAVNMYRDYDYWLRRAGVALNTNVEWQRRLDKSIQDTAISVGLLKPEEVAEAFNTWGAATGVVVDDMDTLRFVTAAVKDVIIATAGAGGSLTSNLKGVAAVLGQFNMGMDRAGHVTRVLTLMTERTQADFGDLAQAFSYVGPLAHSLGITFDDVAQILGALADSGQRGSRAGRGLSMVIEGLSAPSEKAADALDMVVNGFKKGKREWSKVAFPKGDFIGMRGVVIELAKGLYGATDAQRGYVYSTAFSNNATRALIPLVERTIELWRKDKKAMQERRTVLDQSKYSLKSAGEFFENMSNQMTESINAVIGSFQNSFFPIIQMVAVRVMELAKPVLGELQKGLKAVGDWMQANPGFVDMAIQIGAVIAIAVGLIGTLFTVLGTFILLGAGIAYYVSGFGGILLAFSVLGTVIAALVAGIMSNTGGIRDALSQLGNEAATLLRPAIDGISEFQVTMTDVATAIRPLADSAFTAIADAIKWLTQQLRQLNNDPAAKETFEKVAKGAGILLGVLLSLKVASGVLGILSAGLWGVARAMDAVTLATKGLTGIATGAALLKGVGVNLLNIATMLGPVGLLIVGVIAAIGGAFIAYQTNFMGFRDFVDGLVAWVTQTVVPQIQGAFTTVAGWISNIVTTLSPIIAAIWSPFQTLIDVGIPALIKLVEDLAAAYVPVFQNIAAVVEEVFVKQIIPAIGGFISKITEHLIPLLLEVYEWFKVIWDGIVLIVGGALGGIVKDIIEAVTTIAPIVNGVLEFLIRIFGATFSGILFVVQTTLTAIMDIIRGTMEMIRGVVGFFLNLLKGDWGGALGSIKLAVSGVFTLIKGIIENTLGKIAHIVAVGLAQVLSIFEFIFGLEPGSILATIGGFVGNIIQFGKDVIGGLVQGVGAAVSWAINVIGGFIGSILGGIGDFITGKKSGGGGGGGLFNALIDIGKNIVFGLWEGIQRMFQWMIDKVTGFIRDIIPGPIKDFLGISSPSKMMAELGVYIVQGLAQGILNSDHALVAMQKTTEELAGIATAGADRISMALDSQVQAQTGTGVSITTANKKVIRLEVEVTSPDGSIDSMETAQLADLIKGPDLVAALEHMAASV